MTDAPRPATTVVGASVPHDSAALHVTGKARFLDDLPEAPGLLHAWIVTSPHARARLTALDLSAARALPGVVAVSAADIVNHDGQNNLSLPGALPEPLLADGEVFYVGQPVAAVAAPTREAARKAALAVCAVYEPLDPVLTVEEAHARESYVAAPMVMKRGDAAQAIAGAPLRLSGEVRLGAQDHFYLEGQIALVTPGEDGEMHVLSSTQHPSEVQHAVAHVLHRPMSAVTVEVRRLGGGFGGKESQGAHFAALAALLARASGRPVKLRPSRDDDMIITGKRHPFVIRYTVGFEPDGRIRGAEFDLLADCGWSVDLSPGVVSRALCHVDNAYHLPAVRATGYLCRTNHTSHTAFRGFGGPQGVAGIEVALDAIARHLDLDPLAVRQRNVYGPATGTTTPYGQEVEEPLTGRIVADLLEQSDWEARRAAIDAFNRVHPTIRRGLALMPLKFGLSFNLAKLNQAGALVHVYTDGSVHLNHGGIEMGQGLYVKVAQVVAEVFGLSLDRVRVSATATDKVPNTSPTAASTGSDLNGKAAEIAARTIRERLTAVAAKHFETAPEAVTFADNRVFAGNRSLSFAELAEMAHGERVQLSAAGFYKTPKIHFDRATMTGHPFLYYVYGAAVTEVAVDILTGETRVLRADLLQDAGSPLNPAIDKGQVEGAFVQGLGWALMEDVVWDAKGNLLTHAPSTYKIPTSRDVPPVFNARLLEGVPNREDTVFRSKGIGEPPLLLALSGWLAARDAVASLGGHRKDPPLDLPATPEAVLRAVAAMQ
jgi:xanthine dehydrogenase large subunit